MTVKSLQYRNSVNSVNQLMADLEASGAVFTLEDGVVVLDVSEGAIPQEIRSQLHRQKSAIKLTLELRAGQRWLSAQNQAWFSGDQQAAPTDLFTQVLDKWVWRESALRNLHRWQVGECIWGNRRCPDEAVANCRGC